ncbi:hypothetical protein [Salidesulfovibrio onnuriiensis]|uniref:hypothetical protein n=1 Tax=Salidesulfovibrio onnuriiensis TaxID=2583823 RepID=UPI0011C86ADA|nr:hypothetical protein [Salidesulfovibrio onnuriiensis]
MFTWIGKVTGRKCPDKAQNKGLLNSGAGRRAACMGCVPGMGEKAGACAGEEKGAGAGRSGHDPGGKQCVTAGAVMRGGFVLAVESDVKSLPHEGRGKQNRFREACPGRLYRFRRKASGGRQELGRQQQGRGQPHHIFRQRGHLGVN